MADRYWVGGSGNWSDDDNHWATTSGGSPANGNLPTSSDDVFIDANSGFGGGGIITLDNEGPNECHDFLSNSGHVFSMIGTSNGLQAYGSVTFEAGLTYSLTEGGGLSLASVDLGETFTTNGVIIDGYLSVQGAGGLYTLQDNLTLSGVFYQENGTFDANDHNVTANNFYFYAETGYTPTVIMGSGTWEATGNDDTSYPWYVEQYSDQVVTITPETSTIKFSDESEFPKTLYFYDDTANETGKTYNNLWLTGAGGFIITGSNTFNDFKVDTPPHTVRLQGGGTQTISTFTVNGSSGNLITINSDPHSGGNMTSISVNNGGSGYAVNNIVFVDYYENGANQAIVRVASVDGGVVTGISIEDDGYGFLETLTNVPTQTVVGVGTGLTINIDSITGYTQHTLSKSSGTVECDYLDISNSNATGGATWYAGSHSVDTTNNDGWIFGDPVTDITPPVITLLGESSIAIQKDFVYTDAGATALDETDGDITENIVTVNPVNTAIVGLYTITYNVQDAAENNATEVTRTVNVFDVSKSTKRMPHRSRSRMRR